MLNKVVLKPELFNSDENQLFSYIDSIEKQVAILSAQNN
jgi:hypothetical protein